MKWFWQKQKPTTAVDVQRKSVQVLVKDCDGNQVTLMAVGSFHYGETLQLTGVSGDLVAIFPKFSSFVVSSCLVEPQNAKHEAHT